MSRRTIQLELPEDLLDEVRKTATEAQISLGDIMCQAVRAGLPSVREKHCSVVSILAGLKPFSEAERRAAWGPKTDGGESDRIADAMTMRA